LTAATTTATAAHIEGESSVAHALRRLSAYIWGNARFYVMWALITVGYVAGFVGLPLSVGYAIEGVVEGLPRDQVATRAALVFAIAVGRSVFRYYSRLLVFNAAREIEYELRNDLFAHLQRLPQSFYNRWRTGDLMSRCVNDLNSVRLLLGVGVLNILQMPLLFGGVLVAMFAMNPKLAFLVLLPYPAFVVIARTFGGSLHGRNLAVQEGLAQMSNQVQEAVSGIAVVKAYAMEDTQEQRFSLANEELYQRHLRLVRVNGAMPAITSMLPAVAMWIVLLVAGPEISEGSMSVADFFVFTMFIYELTFPTFIMGWVVALVQRGAASMQRIDEVLSIEPSIADRPDAVAVDELSGAIEFRGFSYRYATGRELALDDINLDVPAGSRLGIVGRVGSGKTSLASAIPRLLEVEDGQLFLDGIDINQIPLHTLRRSIAMVPQDSFLFSMTLAENIAYGTPDASAEQVRQAAERAQLAKDIALLPAEYETVVGERGVMLSGGQRQRTALARALALRPSILILDDTLSAVDAETEAAIQDGLDEVFRGRTVVVVAHRVSTVKDCDQVIVMDEGRIVERGSPHELIARGGLYARLAAEQQAEAEREQAESGEGETPS
jgi:ATP-binding cassette subfamily B multidrug efflux pump